MEIFIGRQERSRWGAVWDLIIRVCSWGISKSKSSIGTREQNIDDIAGATSGSREEIEDFVSYVNGFHPSLNFAWVISDVQLSFLDLGQHLIVSSPVYTTRKPTLILTRITHHLTLPVVRIPSLTVSFSVYGASV